MSQSAKVDRLLFVWRHADAGESLDDPDRDFRRELSRKGRDQAAQSARWLRTHLPSGFVLFSSPAPRAVQTARALAEPEIDLALAPGVPSGTLSSRNLHLRAPVTVLVGHQPQLGSFTLAHLEVGLIGTTVTPPPGLAIRKGAIWCLRLRADPARAPLVVAVHDPGFEA